jgi:catechol 2,3-dioxygenase-like lactoylglutathione lyase family enzyme
MDSREDHHLPPTSAPPGPAAARIPVRRVIHAIHATGDLAACRARYLDSLGGLIFAEGYFEPEDRDMALLYVADFMIEPMAPRDPGRQDKAFARYLSRYGAGWHSFELKVDDGPAAAAALKAAGCRLSAEYGFFFYVRPESTGGVLLEVCETPMPNDPHDRRGWRWPEGHRSGVLRLDHIACATPDLEAALALFTGLFDGELIADTRTALPQPARHARVRLADTDVVFVQPDDPAAGPLGEFLQPPSSGVYALVWRVEDEAAAEAVFTGQGLRTTRDGCVSAGFAIAPEDFLGARHEFTAG